MKRIFLFAVFCACMVAGSAGAGQLRVITSLPYTTQGNDDTIEISGSKLTSATNGILISHERILIRANGVDSIVCGTGGSGSNYCIQSLTGDSFRVYGMNLFCGTSTSTHAACISTGSVHDFLIDSCYLFVSGTDAHGHNFSAGGNQVYYNTRYRKTRVETNSETYTSRHDLTGALMYGTANNLANFTSGNARWCLKFDSCSFIGSPSQGILARAAPIQMYMCTIIVDCRNTPLPTQTGNCYSLMLRGSKHGRDSSGAFDSYIRKCVFQSGSTYLGSRHIHIQGASRGAIGRPFYIDSNIFIGHNGDLADGASHYTIQFENESGGSGKYFSVNNNTFTVAIDGSSGTSYRHVEGTAINIRMAATDSGNVIRNNHFTIYSADGGGRVAAAMSIDNGGTGGFNGGRITSYGNKIRTGGAAYWHGFEYAFYTGQMMYEADTVSRPANDSCITTGTGATYYPMLATYGRWNCANSTTAQDTSIYIKDLVITNGFTEDSLKRECGHGAEERFFFVRTLLATATDTLGNVLNGARVTVKDNTGATRWVRNTNSSGQTSDSVIYKRWSHVGNNANPDTTGYNPMTIIGWYDFDGDAVEDNGEADTNTLTIAQGSQSTTLIIRGNIGGGTPVDTTVTIVTPSGTTVNEGQNVSLVISRNVSTSSASYTVNIFDSTALAGTHYRDTSYTATFAAGSLLDTIGFETLVTVGEETISPRYCRVTLSGLPTNYVFANGISSTYVGIRNTTRYQTTVLSKNPSRR